MRLKLDENLPAGLADTLRALGLDVDTVPGEGLAGRADHEVWRAAQDAGRLLLTQDLDFSDLRRFAPGTHHGLLLLRLREPGRRALIDRVRQLLAEHDLTSWDGCFVVATERKVRVRRPRPQ